MNVRDAVVDAVARVPARVRTKLLFAFLVIVAMLVALGLVGLRIHSGMNERNEELIALQRKIAAYRNVQHDATRQLYGVTSALLSGEERALDSVLRRLSNFGYELDRLQLVEKDEAALMADVRSDYDRFIEIVTQAVELARSGNVEAARKLQLTEARSRADRLERLTNQLVNVAEANMLDRIEAGQKAFEESRRMVIGFSVGSVVLALLLGYAFSSSILNPLAQIQSSLRKIAGGDFVQSVEVSNRDELGDLAEDVNRTSSELGSLYSQIEQQTVELRRSVNELEALGEISKAINSSLDIDTVLGRIIAHATELADADAGALYSFDEAESLLRVGALHRFDPEIERMLRREPLALGHGVVGRAGAEKSPVQVPNLEDETTYVFRAQMLAAGYQSILAVPLLRDGALLGGLALCRKHQGAFSQATVELLETLANQSTLAVHNARLFQELGEKSRALEEASRHKSQFLANMSHELRTPMNAILGFAELIQDGIYGEIPDKAHETLGRIEANGKHLLGLINDVLDLSKIEAGQFELELSEYRMEEVVEAVARTSEPLAAGKALALDVEIQPSLPSGLGDPMRLTQVLYNLVGNAIKFTDTGKVDITLACHDDAFEVNVIDTGPGIAKAAQAQIFEEFHQADNSATKKKGGTGLGLSISKRIIEMHGGRIRVKSALGKGAQFTFSIPIRVQRRAAA